MEGLVHIVDGTDRIYEYFVNLVYPANAWHLMKDCKHSILQVCGYRLRLHFDGYLSCYDFWTNAGSPDIHPVGWCEKTKHELHIPKGKPGWKESRFYFNNISWNTNKRAWCELIFTMKAYLPKNSKTTRIPFLEMNKCL